MTERHHNRDELQHHFVLHHIGIEDLGAPHLEQVKELAGILDASKKKGEKLAVHCLAGIGGRTSTMLMAAHMLKGEALRDLQALLSSRILPLFLRDHRAISSIPLRLRPAAHRGLL